MNNSDYLLLLMKYWESRISFDLIDDERCLFRDDSKEPSFKDKSFDNLMLKIRLSIGDLLLQNEVERYDCNKNNEYDDERFVLKSGKEIRDELYTELKPTMELRYHIEKNSGLTMHAPLPVLQQKWVSYVGKEEWRDIENFTND